MKNELINGLLAGLILFIILACFWLTLINIGIIN